MPYITDKLGTITGFNYITKSAVIPGNFLKGNNAKIFNTTLFWGLPLLVILLVLWEIAPKLGWVNAIFFPPISLVWTELISLLKSGEIQHHTYASLGRAGYGFTLALVTAIPLGFLMGRYSLFEKLSDLLVQALRNTSQFALLPVFILLLGIGEASKIAICFYAAFFFILINTISGVKEVDPLLIKAARSMGTSDYALFIKVILPSSIPSITSGARLGIKSAIMSVIGAEILAAQSGLGFLIQHSQLMMQIETMYAGILVLSIIGLLTNYLLVWIESKATSWKIDTDSSYN